MAIFDIINYEAEFEFELMNPTNGEPLNVFFTVVHANAPEGKVFDRKRANYMLRQVRDGKPLDVTVSEDFDKKKVAASIRSWNWNKQEFKKGEGVPEFTPDNLNDVLSVDWIYEQTAKAVNDVANFTNR